jgi:phosphonopyruvate decarboxylase
MLNCAEFYSALTERGVDFFTGVPDSLLKDFNAYVMDNVPSDRHIISANEGGAVALASGYHLATGNVGMVYMQNSGQGNAINPLMSLADPDVYSIPMLLLIGWRGEPGAPKADEPQHVKQGKITIGLLDSLGIPNAVLPDNIQDARATLEEAVTTAREQNRPYGIVVRKGTFEEYKLQNKIETDYELNREDAVKLVTGSLDSKAIVVSTTGKTSRELFEYRHELGHGHDKDFLTVGSMGHSSQIALGIALRKPDRDIYCFDGDGAVLMHMGSLAIIGSQKPANFKHIVFNNGAHDSVGGQPTVAHNIDLPAIARACGYNRVLRAETSEEIRDQMKFLKESEGPSLLEIKVNKGARKDLGRPTTTPVENKTAFMANLKS